MPHKSQKDLQEAIKEAATKVKVGGIYVHYKDASMRYKVKELAVNTEHDTVWVVYRALYDEQLTFLRSVDEWLDEIDKNGKKVKRFTLEEV